MCKYKSIFSPDKEVTAAQYIIEVLSKNKASSIGISLPLQFWELPEWANFYKSQLKKCHEYLKIYHETIIIKVVRERNIYSLYAKWIDDEFKRETKSTLELAKSIEEVSINRIKNSKGHQQKDLDLSYLDE